MSSSQKQQIVENKDTKVVHVHSLKKSGLAVGRWVRFMRTLKEKKKRKEERKRPPQLVRFPWQSGEREAFLARKKQYDEAKTNKLKVLKRMRVKFSETHKPSTIGPGYPGFGLVYANMAIARGDKERKVIKSTSSGNPVAYEPLETELPHPVPEEIFEQVCHRIGVQKYDEKDNEEESEQNMMDVKSLDLYWEDIRIERNIMIKEIKNLPTIASIPLYHLQVLEKSICNLSRSCYYSPSASHKKSEDIIHLIIWLLNRRNMPIAFHIKLLQATSLIAYHSQVFKQELINCGGIRVLFRSIQVGLIVCGLQACWGCYALTMATIGSTAVIKELKEIADFDETIAELSFSMYWYYWPANFASILAGLVFGPGSVTPLDTFSFL